MGMLLEAGRVVGGRWRVDGILGVGSMGQVFAAHALDTGQPAALKVAHTAIMPGTVARDRFHREIRLARRLDHRGTCRLLDSGETPDGMLWFTMERADGESFADWLAAHPDDRGTALGILRRVLEPLAAAHRLGIVHRDLKPDNIVLSIAPDGRVFPRLLDFGIARDLESNGVTQVGLTFGTPLYMSPEQACDPRQCTAASDVWSFGVLLYRVLAGRLPFGGEHPREVLAAIVHGIVPPLPVLADGRERALGELAMQCLAYEPWQRPRDADVLRLAFDSAPATAAPGAAPPESASDTIRVPEPPALLEDPTEALPAVRPRSMTMPRARPKPRSPRVLPWLVAAAGAGVLGALLFPRAHDDALPADTVITEPPARSATPLPDPESPTVEAIPLPDPIAPALPVASPSVPEIPVRSTRPHRGASLVDPYTDP